MLRASFFRKEDPYKRFFSLLLRDKRIPRFLEEFVFFIGNNRAIPDFKRLIHGSNADF